jgi:hypothetical protein
MEVKYKKTEKFVTLKEAIEYDGLHDRHVDALDSRSDFESFKKDQFRKSEEWRWFCRSLIEKRGGVCERCGGTGSDCGGIQVHHRDPENYSDLDESKFVCLCGRCHLIVEARCKTEETMKMCPKVDRRFLTLYPYRRDGEVIMKQSGVRIAKRWLRDVDAQRHPERYINHSTKTDPKMAKEAIDFMKEHPDLFL